MFIFLPDSPVNAPGLTKRERRIAVDRIRENQTGVENKHLKPYQIIEAFKDYKLYMFFILGVVCTLENSQPIYSWSFAKYGTGNVPNGGISNFGTIIIKGFGFSTLVTTLMQVCRDTVSLFTIGHYSVSRYYAKALLSDPLRRFDRALNLNLRLPQRSL
jgi:hypothetical protein